MASPPTHITRLISVLINSAEENQYFTTDFLRSHKCVYALLLPADATAEATAGLMNDASVDTISPPRPLAHIGKNKSCLAQHQIHIY